LCAAGEVAETSQAVAAAVVPWTQAVAQQTSENFFRLFSKVPPPISAEASVRIPRPSTSAA